MIYIIFFLICFGASIIGTICGVGGGILIKPLLDSFGILDISTISFLSGCTVLSMSAFSVFRNQRDKSSTPTNAAVLLLGIGAALGGLVGKNIFHYLKMISSAPEQLGAIQALCLLLITICTLLYTLCKSKITTLHITNRFLCILIGFFLGTLSSFLGIGGGPVNLVVLFFFFSMSTKVAAQSSLYIILLSQITSLGTSILTKTVPDFSVGLLILMVIGGIVGSISGRFINQRISEKGVDKLFIGLMVVIIFINIYNLYQFSTY